MSGSFSFDFFFPVFSRSSAISFQAGVGVAAAVVPFTPFTLCMVGIFPAGGTTGGTKFGTGLGTGVAGGTSVNDAACEASFAVDLGVSTDASG
ncbi:hypothetical protein GCM10008933_33490 [Paenibacillus motobuensis]|uniref:Uncharacterized protein n=1 Tax=Paenibacillus motobuensis TaxID=295324 RepID=A0ABN0YLZ3_9BACL